MEGSSATKVGDAPHGHARCSRRRAHRSQTERRVNEWQIWVIFFKSMRKYKSLNSRVSFEALQKKRGISPQLYIFLGAEFLELKVFGNVELKWSYKNESETVPNTPIKYKHVFGLGVEVSWSGSDLVFMVFG